MSNQHIDSDKNIMTLMQYDNNRRQKMPRRADDPAIIEMNKKLDEQNKKLDEQNKKLDEHISTSDDRAKELEELRKDFRHHSKQELEYYENDAKFKENYSKYFFGMTPETHVANHLHLAEIAQLKPSVSKIVEIVVELQQDSKQAKLTREEEIRKNKQTLYEGVVKAIIGITIAIMSASATYYFSHEQSDKVIQIQEIVKETITEINNGNKSNSSPKINSPTTKK